MAIRVFIIAPLGNKITMEVTDGHDWRLGASDQLEILNKAGDRVVIFAPGEWIFAEKKRTLGEEALVKCSEV